jgi:hypothetical protein
MFSGIDVVRAVSSSASPLSMVQSEESIFGAFADGHSIVALGLLAQQIEIQSQNHREKEREKHIHIHISVVPIYLAFNPCSKINLIVFVVVIISLKALFY